MTILRAVVRSRKEENAFQRFLVTFEANPLGWNRGEGYKFDEPDYSNPAIKQLKIAAAVALAKSKNGLTYRIYRFFYSFFFFKLSGPAASRGRRTQLFFTLR
jgi:hypothetical protein